MTICPECNASKEDIVFEYEDEHYEEEYYKCTICGAEIVDDGKDIWVISGRYAVCNKENGVL